MSQNQLDENSEEFLLLKKDIEKFLEMNSQKFFPDQTITFYQFSGLSAIINTVYQKKNSDGNSPDDPIEIEYKTVTNFIDNTEHVGPQEEKDIIKDIDQEKPFTISIDSLDKLSPELETKFLQNYETIFIGMLEIILSHSKNIIN